MVFLMAPCPTHILFKSYSAWKVVSQNIMKWLLRNEWFQSWGRPEDGT
jgi:hypothetical protein